MVGALIVMGIIVFFIIWANLAEVKDDDEAVAIIAAADKGDETAQRKLYELFDKGLTSEKHNQLRMKLYKASADAGDVNAQYWMGFLSVVEKDPIRAEEWYLKAAKGGNVKAMRNLAQGYSALLNEANTGEDINNGLIGFGKNDREYIGWLRFAAANGDAESMCDLGDEYFYGDIVENSDNKALELYGKAANRNYARAYLKMASVYQSKNRNEKNKQKEMLFKALLCCEGNPDNADIFESACFQLGYLYGGTYLSNGVEDEFSDRRKATYFFYMSYVRGNQFGGELIYKLGYDICKAEELSWRKDAICLHTDFLWLEL